MKGSCKSGMDERELWWAALHPHCCHSPRLVPRQDGSAADRLQLSSLRAPKCRGALCNSVKPVAVACRVDGTTEAINDLVVHYCRKAVCSTSAAFGVDVCVVCCGCGVKCLQLQHAAHATRRQLVENGVNAKAVIWVVHELAWQHLMDRGLGCHTGGPIGETAV
jgi:hypothetical protein